MIPPIHIAAGISCNITINVKWPALPCFDVAPVICIQYGVGYFIMMYKDSAQRRIMFSSATFTAKNEQSGSVTTIEHITGNFCSYRKFDIDCIMTIRPDGAKADVLEAIAEYRDAFKIPFPFFNRYSAMIMENVTYCNPLDN